MQEVTYNILGPLDVRSAGRPVEITRGRPRSLLAVLLLSNGETVSAARLVDAVWGPSPPASADQLVRVYVSQLRQVLGEESIVTRHAGYAIAAGADRIDAVLFEQQVHEAARLRESGQPLDALALYDQALAVWRGPVLADTPVSADAAARAAHLEDLRWHGIEERADIQLELGRHHEVVPELERLVSAQPFRERLIAQLMLALYRSGRQADALQTYQDAHRRFIDELGLTPNPTLRELQQAILHQERRLDPPESPTEQDRPRRARRVVVAAGVAAVVAIVGIGVALNQLSPSRTLTVQRDSVVELDSVNGAIRQVTTIQGALAALSAGNARIWVVNTARRTLNVLNASDLALNSTIGLRAIPHELVYDGASTWVANGFIGTLSRIGSDGVASPPFRPEPRSVGRLALAFGAGSLWVGSQDGVIARLTPLGRVTSLIRGIHAPEAIAVGFRSAWVAQATSVDLLRIDTRTNRIVRRIPLGGIPAAVRTSQDAVWALAPGEGQLWRIDPRTNSVTASIEVGPNTSSLVVTRRGVWVVADSLGTLTRVDPRSNTATQTIDLHHPIGGVSAAGDRLFLTTR
jgi:DNA-binding SARP family transcriptional activator